MSTSKLSHVDSLDLALISSFIHVQTIATITSTTVYGINIALAATCAYALWKSRHGATSSSPDIKKTNPRAVVLVIYVIIMFCLSTMLMVAVGIHLAQRIHQILNHSGHLSAEQIFNLIKTHDKVGEVAFLLTSCGADLLMVWRVIVVYKCCRVSLWMVGVVPVLLFLASFTTGTMSIVSAFLKQQTTKSYIHAQVMYSMATLALNVVLTAMIVGRLLLYRSRVRKALGSRHGSHYTSIISIVIESEAIVVLFDIAVMVVFFMDKTKPKQYAGAVLQVLAQIQVFAPLLLMYRVTMNKVWSNEIMDEISTTEVKKQLDGLSLTQAERRVP